MMVLWKYQRLPALVGMTVASALAIGACRMDRTGVRMICLSLAVLVAWATLFLGVDAGYRAWQGTPNAPEEAFSDSAGPFVFLFLGWVPALIFVTGVVALSGLFARRESSGAPPVPPQ